MTATYSKDRDGRHIMTTKIPLDSERRELRIETCKAYAGGVVTRAIVVQLHEDGRGFSHTIGLGAGGDFSVKVVHDHAARATEKAVRAQHAKFEYMHAFILERAKAHYKTETTDEPA
jgi:hypothetical protein